MPREVQGRVSLNLQFITLLEGSNTVGLKGPPQKEREEPSNKMKDNLIMSK